ncbi:MAG: hypothetical protein JJLCMIEE_02393 [Acidimicrobiales bacterium]|nr:hypothetical protein [Acidimicrobiales bacterium]
MDIDRYIAVNQPAWLRLQELTVRAQRSVADIPPVELDELIQLYQRVSAQLSHARTYYGDRHLTSRLTQLVAGARVVIYTRRGRALDTARRFFTEAFPGAVWTSRRFVLASAVLFFGPTVAVGVWLSNSQEALRVAIPQEAQDLIVESQFEDYYSTFSADGFAAMITFNNIWVSFLAITGGILLGAGSIFFLVYNGLQIGAMAAVMHAGGAADAFWGLIIPHGLLELSAITIAGGAGLRMGWAIIAPGDRSRVESLAEAALRAVVIAIGLTIVFLVAALIEAFVTPSDLPTFLRIGIGVAFEMAFLSYLVVYGKRAEASGAAEALGRRRPRSWADEPTVTLAPLPQRRLRHPDQPRPAATPQAPQPPPR